MLLCFVSIFSFTVMFPLMLKFSCMNDPDVLLWLYCNGWLCPDIPTSSYCKHFPIATTHVIH
jgi:hypothetical protein